MLYGMPEKPTVPKVVRKTVDQILRESRELRERADKLMKVATELRQKIAELNEWPRARKKKS
jgi:hypothetical protein